MNKASDDDRPREMTVAEWIRYQLLNDLPLEREFDNDVTTFARQGTY